MLSAKWALLAKKTMGPDIFCLLQCQTRGGICPPKSMPVYVNNDMVNLESYEITTKQDQKALQVNNTKRKHLMSSCYLLGL